MSVGCVSKSKYQALLDKNSLDTKLLDDKLIDSQKQLQLAMQDKSKLKQDLADLAKYKQNADKRISEFKKLTEKFQSLINAGKLKVKLLNGRMVVVMSTDILFQSGSAVLNQEGAKEIEQVSLVLKDLENKEFQIAGHTDNIPIKSGRNFTNWNLAANRAYTVLKTMLDSGFPRERISIASYAETKPVSENSSRESRAMNRRIEIVVVPDLSQLPGHEDLEKMFSK